MDSVMKLRQSSFSSGVVGCHLALTDLLWEEEPAR
ncbi:hypothetical protein MTBUT4_20023 [Magnetospirillum sp. UT-4]|nr:hypothetical protein MTBUT4_20023 [Magnetospirillum sp. UT-4]